MVIANCNSSKKLDVVLQDVTVMVMMWTLLKRVMHFGSPYFKKDLEKLT